MRRIIFSIILGIVTPVSYLALMAFIEDFLPAGLMITTFYGQKAPGLLLAPFTLPIYFDIFVKAERFAPLIFDTPFFRLVTFILFDWALYGLISYFVLGRLKRFKKRTVTASETPPPPPNFGK